jgi:disulfide bond formation protein DsbB
VGAVYAGALAAIGAVISLYHVALEWIPALDTGACDPDNPCTLVWFRVFGFISLPLLALAAFLLILTVLSIRPREADDGDPATRRNP